MLLDGGTGRPLGQNRGPCGIRRDRRRIDEGKTMGLKFVEHILTPTREPDGTSTGNNVVTVPS